jgi:hypothetical protein
LGEDVMVVHQRCMLFRMHCCCNFSFLMRCSSEACIF